MRDASVPAVFSETLNAPQLLSHVETVAESAKNPNGEVTSSGVVPGNAGRDCVLCGRLGNVPEASGNDVSLT